MTQDNFVFLLESNVMTIEKTLLKGENLIHLNGAIVEVLKIAF